MTLSLSLSLLLSSSSSLSLSSDYVVGSGGSSRGRGEFKNPMIIPYTEPTMMTEPITPRSGSETPRKKDNMKFHTFSNATLFFEDVGAVNIIGGVRCRPQRGIGGNVMTASIGARTMTIALLLSSAACRGHAFASAGCPAACFHGRHNNDLYACVISKGRSCLCPSSSPATATATTINSKRQQKKR